MKCIGGIFEVLPFKNDSPDADNQYFADGMMDEILNHLQKIAELGVKSRTAVEPYRNSTQAFAAIAQELDEQEEKAALRAQVREMEEQGKLDFKPLDG